MSEEENIEYKSGDIVWVKLGSFWWPGEVTDQGPEDVSTKKPPVAIVKFFGEDNFEYVMSPKNIYPYNCERKHEFIKKGMDSYRGKNQQVEKFPLDINTAETRTDGNVNILFDIYSQQKKTNVVAEVFGTPTPKKSTKNTPHRYRFKKSSNMKKKTSSAKIAKGITHRRFLGCDDYEMRIRVQYPGKDVEPNNSDDDQQQSQINDDETKKFPCSTCGFITDRLEVMLFHVQCHIKGIVTPSTGLTKKKKSTKKPRKIIRNIELSDDDDDNNDNDDDHHTLSSIDSEDDIIKRKQKRKRKSQGSNSKIKQKKSIDEKSKIDIRTNLLAEWSDSEDLEQDDNNQTNNDKKDENKSSSCFDFDDDDDDDDNNSIVQTTVSGRKIPRVIPPNDRRKSTDPDNENASLPLAEDDETRIGYLNKANNNNNNNNENLINESSSSNNVNDESNSTKETTDFKDLMDSTTVPDLPDIPTEINNKTDDVIVPTINKLPDKPKIDNSTEVATRLTNPKKRFVKSFEDFELLLNEQKKAMEEVELTTTTTIEKEEESKKDDDKPETIIESAIDEMKDKQVEIEKNIECCEKDEKQQIEREKTVVPQPEIETKLEISKLKCQIMSKITDEEQQQQQQQQELTKIKTKSSHRTPRSKILESYRNDTTTTTTTTTTNEKKRRKSFEEKKDDLLNETNKQHDKHPTKKSKYLRSTSIEEEKQHIEEEVVEKIEQKTEKTIVEEDKKQVVEDDKKIVESDKTAEIVVVVEEEKTNKKSDTIQETIESSASIETNEKLIDQKDDNVERLFKLDDKKDDDNSETVKSDIEEKSTIETDTDQPVDEVVLKTNLSNDEEMSALTTLATISQLQTTFDDKIDIESVKPTTSFDEQFLNKTVPPPPPPSIESELITIDGNLTVVSEKDLADGQVEITTDLSPTNKKPVTLTTFSMDFSESTNDSCNNNNNNNNNNNENDESSKVVLVDESQRIDKKKDEIIDKTIKESIIQIQPISKSPSILLDNEICDVEEHIPSSQIVCTQETDKIIKTIDKKQSKLLLERLTTITTTTNTKDIIKSTKPKVQNLLTTNEPKVPIITKDISSKIITTTTATTTIMAAAAATTTTTTLTTKPLITKQLQSKLQTKVLSSSSSSSPKAIILSEQIIKSENPVIGENANTVSVQKISSKRNMQDPDEIDTFIIHKSKTINDEQNIDDNNDDLNKNKNKKTILIDSKKQQTPISISKKRGKAKILQQTIITPSGEIVQPTISTTQQQQQQQQNNDENVFDINSMPIVLSDQILTPESIENMPIFLSDTTQTGTEIVTTTPTTTKLITTNVIKKPTSQLQTQQQQQMKILNKSMIPSSIVGTVVDKTPKIMKTTTKLVSPIGSKIIKSNSFTPGGSSSSSSTSSTSNKGKFVIVSQAATITSTPTTTSKYTVGKKHIIKRPASEITGTLTKLQNVTSEPSGNKIMILTNQQGQQQRVLLTPAQQKLMGYQTPGAKVTKTLVKGNIIQKTATPGSSGLLTKTVVQSPTTTQRITTGQTLITSSGQVLTPISSKQVRIEKQQPTLQRKIPIQSQKVNIKGPPQQKTILIKNQHGQTVRKIQGTDEELLNQQVKEQIEAIKASGGLAQPQLLQQQQQQKSEISYKGNTKTIRRSYAKKTIESPKITTKSITTSSTISNNKSETVIPPLTPISPKKSETTTTTPTTSVVGKEKLSIAQQQTEINKQTDQQQRPLNQLVIQDAMGNQTTITEGQILALPSETVDGQPQSYMLVTLDESGNLTPLNNEALMSLDPNLGLGADLGNTVLQIDQNTLKDNQQQQQQNDNVEINKTTETIVPTTITKTVTTETTKLPEQTIETVQQQQQISSEPSSQALQTVNCSVSSDGNGGQQLIVTGDPVAAQKFLESLTEGNTDLANILMSTEGSILVHADGQQILINTDNDNQMLLSLGEQTSEGGGNPIFATQPTKNQDILAAALADTDVFQQEQNAQQGNVLETSLTLNSPIMTPLEVPSTNNKKIITNENDILTTQISKNVDLPITITDPNISQTVAQQQQQVAASMMVNELQNNLELTLPDTSTISSVTSSEMNSPSSFVYSLPNLDESVDINQKPFNSSMPLLTEDTEETTTTTTNKDTKIDEKISKNEEDEKKDESITETTTTTSTTTITSPIATTTTSTTTTVASVGNFLYDNGLCSLGGEMCSSLSEPPPDMFDLSAVLSSDVNKTDDDDDDNTETKIEKNDNKQETVKDEKEKDPSKEEQSNTDKTTTNSPNSLNEDDSCEIPVQPEIVTNLTDVNQDLDNNKNKTTDVDDKDGKDEKM